MANIFTRLFKRGPTALSLPIDANPIEATIIDPKKAAVKPVGLQFVRSGGGRQSWETAQYSFEDITKAYNTDSYVRQALDKYTELIFKSGWEYVGKNEAAVTYVKQRFSLMAFQTGIPTKQLLFEVSEDIVKFANAFIIKARAKGSGTGINIPGLKVAGIAGAAPISGYFILPATTIQIARDKNGTVLQYQQKASGAQPLIIKPEDMIHFFYKRDHGYAFGNPFMSPVIDDVKLLREVELNVAQLLYKHTNPLVVYTVGVAQPGMEATDIEIANIKNEVENMPTHGGIAIPERHKIEIVGVEGEAISAEKYLQYFEQRVFTGLGLPETVLGRGGSANRGTSDNLAVEARDRIKAFQSIIELFVNSFMVMELLMEGGFDPLGKPEDLVEFRFNEIDIDNKIKVESHAIQLWTQDLITQDEARIMIGRDVLGGDTSLLYSSLVKMPEIDAGKPDPAPGSGSGTADNKARPANQNGKKTGPKKGSTAKPIKNSIEDSNLQDFDTTMSNTTSDSSNSFSRKLHINTYENQIGRYYSMLESDVISYAKRVYDTNKEYEPKEVELVFNLALQSIEKYIEKYMDSAIQSGVRACKSDCGISRAPDVDTGMISARVAEGCRKDIQRLFEDLMGSIDKAMKSEIKSESLGDIIAIFNSLEYRVAFMARSQSMRSYNYAYAMTARAYERTHVSIIAEDDTSCEECINKAKDKLLLKGDIYYKTPPWHTNCWCHLKAE